MKPANYPLSVTLTLLVHLVALGLFFWQGSINRKPPPERPQAVVQAQVVREDPAVRRQESQRQAAAQQQRQREAAEARRRQQEAERQRQAEQERQAALQRQREEQARQQAEQERQRQEQQRQEQQRVEAERQRQLQLQRQRDEEQRQRTEAERQRAEEDAIRRRVEEQRQREADAQRAEEVRIRESAERAREEARAAQAARDDEAVATMEGIMFDMISRHWTRPPGVDGDLETHLQVQLMGTGEIAPNGIRVTRSSGNAAFDRSAMQAVERAAPFPLLRLEPRQRDRFRVIDLIFTPEDLAL